MGDSHDLAVDRTVSGWVGCNLIACFRLAALQRQLQHGLTKTSRSPGDTLILMARIARWIRP